MHDSKYSRLRKLMLLAVLASLIMSNFSKGQVVEFQGYGVRQHIIKPPDSYSNRAIAYEKANVSLILDDNSVLLIERYGINDVDTILFEIRNEVFNETAFHFDLIDIEYPTRNLKGQFRPRPGEFVIMFYDESLAVVFLNLKRKNTSNEQILSNKEAWENRGLAQ